MVPAYVTGFHTIGKHSETAGTVIQENIPGQEGRLIGLTEILYTAAATEHTVSLLYPGNLDGCRTTADGSAAAGQKDLDVADSPTDPAGNAAANGDLIAYYTADGWEFNVIDSVSSKTITLDTDIAAAVADGAKVRIFGVVGDGACFQLPMEANATTEYGAGSLIIAEKSVNRGDPMILQSDNGTDAGTLVNAVFVYMQK